MIKAIMERKTTLTDQRMRSLLQSGRRASGNLSQKEAAQQAQISAVYWQKIESGTQQSVPTVTLAAMFTAIGITAGQLRVEGYNSLAEVAADLQAAAATTTPLDHLAATPGATAEEIGALQAVWRALKAGRVTEPYEQELQRNRRPRDQDT